jgi:hypothetical protein
MLIVLLNCVVQFNCVVELCCVEKLNCVVENLVERRKEKKRKEQTICFVLQ